MKTAAIILLSICAAAFAQQKGTFTDPRDKKAYKTVQIGEQTWFAENLSYKAEGSACYGEGKDECVESKFENTPFGNYMVCGKHKKLTTAQIQANCQKYGRLYGVDGRLHDYEAATPACPAGWKLPSGKDWQVLVDFAGGYESAGKKLKAKSGWSKNGNGTDTYGFAALPSGGSDNFGNPDSEEGDVSYFADAGSRGGWIGGVSIGTDSTVYKSGGSSVRCLKMTAEEEKAAAEKEAAEKAKADSIAKAEKAAAEKAAFEKAAEEAAGKLAGKQFNPKIKYGSMTDARDKITYKTVKIGEQTWMAENLNYNGSGSKCFNGKENYCKMAGRLYDRAVALKACPAGWHLPTDEEWTALDNFAGGWNPETASKLKAASGWLDSTGKKPLNGTDNFGFSALPGGYYYGGSFYDVGSGYWWSATAKTGLDGIHRKIAADNYIRSSSSNSLLFSVRCLQGDAKGAASAPAENPSKQMYCVIYMGGKVSSCMELRDTQADKANCDMQNSGMKMMRGEARWTDAKPSVKCSKN